MDEASLLECIISYRDERADGTIQEAYGLLLAPRKSADKVVLDFASHFSRQGACAGL
jgi:hypothetical protein